MHRGNKRRACSTFKSLLAATMKFNPTWMLGALSCSLVAFAASVTVQSNTLLDANGIYFVSYDGVFSQLTGPHLTPRRSCQREFVRDICGNHLQRVSIRHMVHVESLCNDRTTSTGSRQLVCRTVVASVIHQRLS